METRLEVSRGPRGLRVHLPAGRTLDIRADAAGVQFIERMLRDKDEAAHEARHAKGYIGDFPTQHIIDIWEKSGNTLDEEAARIKAEQAAERKALKEKEWADKGVDVKKLEFKL